MLEEGTFREDLYYRLSVIYVTTPPLRKRVDELPLLIQYFITEAADKLQREPVQLSDEVKQALLRYQYPGNIRELQNIMYRLSCLAGENAYIGDLPFSVRPDTADVAECADAQRGPFESLEQARNEAVKSAESAFLQAKLKEYGGNVSRMSKSLKMNRSYLQTLLKKHGIRSKDFRKSGKKGDKSSP